MFVFIAFALCIFIIVTIVSYYYQHYYSQKNRCRTRCFKTTIVRQSNQNSMNSSPFNDSLVSSPCNASFSGIGISAQVDDNLIRNRFRFRNSQLNYISPNSIYGYVPHKSGNSIKNEKPKATRQFTVKLSPFPTGAISPNTFTNRLPIVKSEHNDDSMKSGHNAGESMNEHLDIVSNTNETSPIRVTNWGTSNNKKRPMIFVDDHENMLSKKSRNREDDSDIEVDEDDNIEPDSRVSPTQSSITSTNKNDKTLKRSTNVLDNENQFIIPKKRVRNNEILSSYSSTNSNLQNQLAVNKRKFSPETQFSSLSNNNVMRKAKKLSHIEELELMTSQVKPSSISVFSAVADSANEISDKKNTDSKKIIILDDDDGEESNSDDILTTEIEIESDDTKDPDPVIELNSEDDDAVESSAVTENFVPHPNNDERLYPIPTYVFSIKDHEHDKKKNKNRLNRFMAALQQANQELDDNSDQTSNVTSKQLLTSTSSAFQPIEPLTNSTITTTIEALKSSVEPEKTSNDLSAIAGNELLPNVPIIPNNLLKFSLTTATKPSIPSFSTAVTTTTSATDIKSLKNDANVSFSIILPAVTKPNDTKSSSGFKFGVTDSDSGTTNKSSIATDSSSEVKAKTNESNATNFSFGSSTFQSNLSNVSATTTAPVSSSQFNVTNSTNTTTFALPSTTLSDNLTSSTFTFKSSPINTPTSTSNVAVNIPSKPLTFTAETSNPGTLSQTNVNSSIFGSMQSSNQSKSTISPSSNDNENKPSPVIISNTDNNMTIRNVNNSSSIFNFGGKTGQNSMVSSFMPSSTTNVVAPSLSFSNSTFQFSTLNQSSHNAQRPAITTNPMLVSIPPTSSTMSSSNTMFNYGTSSTPMGKFNFGINNNNQQQQQQMNTSAFSFNTPTSNKSIQPPSSTTAGFNFASPSVSKIFSFTSQTANNNNENNNNARNNTLFQNSLAKSSSNMFAIGSSSMLKPTPSSGNNTGFDFTSTNINPSSNNGFNFNVSNTSTSSQPNKFTFSANLS